MHSDNEGSKFLTDTRWNQFADDLGEASVELYPIPDTGQPADTPRTESVKCMNPNLMQELYKDCAKRGHQMPLQILIKTLVVPGTGYRVYPIPYPLVQG